MLYKQKVNGNKKISNDELTALFRQKSNRKIFGAMPYLKLYYIGKARFDSSKVVNKMEEVKQKYEEKIEENKGDEKKVNKLQAKRDKKLESLEEKLEEGNWLMRTVGEPPALYDSSLTHETARQMEFYYNSKGFFNNNVNFEVDTTEKFVYVNYHVIEGTPHKINAINYDIEDSVVNSIVEKNKKDIAIKVGENYSEAKISAERERITNILKNNGYFDFSRQFIFFDVDTTQEKQKAAITLRIENPPNEDKHKRYSISKVVFVTDAQNTENIQKDTSIYKDIHFVLPEDRYSQKILDQKIRIYPGDLYNQSRIQLSQRQLAGLDMFKFININFEKNKNDTLNNSLTAYIYTSPLKKYQISDEAGLNVSYGFIPGPFGSLSFKERNAFGGFEVFELNLRASIIGQAGLIDSAIGESTRLNPANVYRSEEWNADVSLTFPQFFFPTPIRRKLQDYNPKTKVILGYTIINRPEYRRGNLRSSLNYSFNKSIHSFYNFSIVDVNLINTTSISEDFNNYLIDLESLGNQLRASFGRSFVSSINGSYIFNNNVLGANTKSKYYKYYVESGGTLLNLFNKTPFFENNDSIFGIKTFRYLKLVGDWRFYFPVKKNTFVFRFNIGVAKPYDNAEVLPYERYFFTGGSNSIRAWPPRRLGPGSLAKEPKDYVYERPGELLIENNYEYRFKIAGFFEGATFIDIGNVWFLSEKQVLDKPETKFNIGNFYKQLAVGTGFGLRLNFSFLILRLDLGIKAWDPAQTENKFVLFSKSGFRKPAYNIGIGYPF